MIELAILGLLDEQDLHGYELKKQLGELVGARSGVSFGSLYPALARLEKAGAVKAVEAHTDADPAIPMTGALSGELAAFRARITRPVSGRRTKKVYGITDVGRRRLRELLLDDRTDDRTFTLQVAFCQTLRPDERLERFEARRRELERRLAERSRSARASSRPNTYRRSLREHDTQTITNDLAWLDELLAAARAELASTDEVDHVHGGSHR